MNEKEPPAALISALTTEHFVLQSALSSNTSEGGTRASLYLFSLSSSLVALGFASRSPELFVPFVAIVLPALFILGLFTVVRLVDSNLEGDSVSDRDRPHPPILSEAEPRRGGSLPWAGGVTRTPRFDPSTVLALIHDSSSCRLPWNRIRFRASIGASVSSVFPW